MKARFLLERRRRLDEAGPGDLQFPVYAEIFIEGKKIVQSQADAGQDAPSRGVGVDGEKKRRRTDRMGAIRAKTLRSRNDSRTRPSSPFFRYRSPPWISFEVAWVVPDA